MPRQNLIRDLAGKLGRSLKIGKCPAALNKAVEDLGLPVWLMQLLWWSWVNKSGFVYPSYNLDSVADILKNWRLQEFLAERMLPIGSAGNGDPIVIKYTDESAEVGFISHEETRAHGLAAAFHPVTSTLDEFLLRIVDEWYLPIDSFAAREYIELRAEMKNSIAT